MLNVLAQAECITSTNRHIFLLGEKRDTLNLDAMRQHTGLFVNLYEVLVGLR